MLQRLATHPLSGACFAAAQLLLVVCCCLAIFGDRFSTNLAQSDSPNPPSIPAFASIVPPVSSRQRRKKRRSEETDAQPDVAASYARFSSSLQRDDSIEQQQAKCQAAALRNGQSIHSDLEFSDRAVSGTKRDRQGLNRMLDAASRGEFKTLYLYSLNRLARESVITMPLLKKLVSTHGVRVFCVADGVDTDNNGWELIASIYAVIHEQFIKDLGKAVLRGQEHALQAGYSVGDLCFGYRSEPVPGTEQARAGRNAKPRKTYAIDEEQAEWVVQIFTWYVDEDRSINWIVRELNRLQVPKDHRATSSEWHHQRVVNLLSQPKYAATWPWGERKNVRDPETGQIRQEFRPEEECAQYTRELPHLRIIDDFTFERAQAKLIENAEKWEKHRNAKGQLKGSSAESNGRSNVRLLHNLPKCKECGSPFHSDGKRLRCRGGKRGTCGITTTVRRKLAERLILDAIGQEIRQNETWFEVVYATLRQQHQEFEDRVPAAISAKQRELGEINRKIKNLLDLSERGEAPPELTNRLQERRQERTDVQRDLQKLQQESRNDQGAPTREWLREQLDQLGAVLNGATPAANRALRELVGGEIVMEQVPIPLRKKHYFRAHLSLKVHGVCSAIGCKTDTASSVGECIDLAVDLIAPDETDRQREIAMELYDQGLPMHKIGERLGVSRSRVTAIIKTGFALRGEPVPDPWKRRVSLDAKHKKPSLYQEIADAVMKRCNEGALLQEIADELGVDRNTVTSAIKYWHTSRGLPIPDGRTRRKSLDRKVSG